MNKSGWFRWALGVALVSGGAYLWLQYAERKAQEAAQRKAQEEERCRIVQAIRAESIGIAKTDPYFGLLRLYCPPEQVTELLAEKRARADAGDAEAQHALAEMWLDVPRDEAVKWYRKAAEQGHAEAQHDLGWMYHLGRGVPEDKAEAARWYKQAAEQGHLEAQYWLGEMYYHGWGVPQDYREAYIWGFIEMVNRGESPREVCGPHSGEWLCLSEEGHTAWDLMLMAELLTPAERRVAQQEAKRRWQAIESRRAHR